MNAVQVELVGTCDPKHRRSWGGQKAGRDYLYWPDAPDWALAARIVEEHPGFDLPFAERIVDQTGAFLAACAANRGASLSPSGTVDIGWHAFILHTLDYAAFCERVAGRFLHHVPDTPEEGEEGKAAAARERTLDAITAAGYKVDAELWPEAAKCTQCHGGCHDSPAK